MNAILDPVGRPVGQRRGAGRVVLKHLRTTWKTYCAVGALLVSVFALWISYWALQTNRQLAHLDFRPELRINAVFLKDSANKPYYVVNNIGAVSAEQVSVDMWSHYFDPKQGRIARSLWSSECSTSLGDIAPEERRRVLFSEPWLDRGARLEAPIQNNILEIRLRYRRAQDLRAYDVSAYYMVNPEGLWVPEDEITVQGPFYSKLREVIASHHAVDVLEFANRGAPLYINQVGRR